MPDLRTRALLWRPLTLASVAVAWAATPLLAGPLDPSGDGSRFDNPDLVYADAEGCAYCAPYAPAEPLDAGIDLDWSLALRGAYVHATDGSYFEVSAAPSVTLSHQTLRGGYDGALSAEVVRSELEEWRVGSITVSLDGAYKLDTDTTLSGGLDLSLTQASANAPGTEPTIAAQPQVWSGGGNLELARALGPLVVTARGDVLRTVYGPTTQIDASEVDNTERSNWRAGTGLRLGYRITPVLTPFIDASIGYQWYDAPSAAHLVRLDAMDLEARAGISAQWLSVLEAEASVGYGIRSFADPSLDESGTLLVDASITARPDETIELRGSLSTSHGAPEPGSDATARLEYAATAGLAYRVNPWLALRTSAGWTHTELIGTTDTEDSHTFGIGADFLLNEHTSLTADYGYTSTVASPEPAEDEHRVTLGIVLRR